MLNQRVRLGRQARITLLGILVAILVGGLAGLKGASDAWVLGAAIALLIPMFMLDREALLYVCFGAVYLFDWMALTLHALPAQAPWLLEVAIAVLFVRSVLSAYEAGVRRVHPVLGVFFGIVALSAALALASGVSATILILGLRTYLRFPLLGLSIAIAPFGEGFDTRLWRALVAIGALQIVVSLYQALTIGPGDFASGTFGLGAVAVEGVFLVALAATFMIRGVVLGREVKVPDVVFGALLLVPTLIGSVIAVYALVPACVLFGLAVFGRRFGRTVLGAAAIVLSLAVVAPFALHYTVTNGYVKNATDPLTSVQALIRYDEGSSAGGTALGRVDSLLIARELTFRTDPMSAFFGHGPGAASSSSLGSWYGGPLLSYPGVRFITTGLALSLIELGLMGVLAFLCTFVAAIRESARVVRREAPEALKLVAAFTGILGFETLITGAYINAWFLPGTALAFWAALGLLLSRGFVGELAQDGPCQH